MIVLGAAGAYVLLGLVVTRHEPLGRALALIAWPLTGLVARTWAALGYSG